MQKLEKEISKLKKENKELKDKVEAVRPVSIDKVEYKIHELHVDTLSGTLNVGLTANGDEASMGEVIDKIVEEHRSNVVVEDESSRDNNQPPANASQ
nr:spore germination protein GerPC [Paenactinomyces guangxiensis]